MKKTTLSKQIVYTPIAPRRAITRNSSKTAMQSYMSQRRTKMGYLSEKMLSPGAKQNGARENGFNAVYTDLNKVKRGLI